MNKTTAYKFYIAIYKIISIKLTYIAKIKINIEISLTSVEHNNIIVHVCTTYLVTSSHTCSRRRRVLIGCSCCVRNAHASRIRRLHIARASHHINRTGVAYTSRTRCVHDSRRKYLKINQVTQVKDTSTNTYINTNTNIYFNIM